jgi:hypothetical protein
MIHKSSSGDQKRQEVYLSELAPDPELYEYNDSYTAYSVDTDINEIMAYATDTTRFGNRSDSGNQSSNRIPYSEWIQLPEEQQNKILAKRKQERLENARCSQTSHPTTHYANTHNVETYIDLDSIIDNAILYEPNNDNDVPTGTTEGNSYLLAYMAGQLSSSGDIHQVFAAKRAPYKQKKRQVNESTSAPPTLTMNSDTYKLHKDESINYQGHQYFSYMTKCHYWVGQHGVGDMEYALVDRGANGGICGTDMLVLEGSERFVDFVGLAGYKVSQLRIVTAQALVSTHKRDAIATFHQMALLGKGKSILSCL